MKNAVKLKVGNEIHLSKLFVWLINAFMNQTYTQSVLIRNAAKSH